ncbi:hypothetical protein GCM10022236_50430 [Microlunatus ginsengisoli]|uniref:Uncharacterized protein n=1 Tax=Microlunatus ginsengisoli TaxID=363863 RepID=A0ABP7AWL4_9ACTN
MAEVSSRSVNRMDPVFRPAAPFGAQPAERASMRGPQPVPEPLHRSRAVVSRPIPRADHEPAEPPVSSATNQQTRVHTSAGSAACGP